MQVVSEAAPPSFMGPSGFWSRLDSALGIRDCTEHHHPVRCDVLTIASKRPRLFSIAGEISAKPGSAAALDGLPLEGLADARKPSQVSSRPSACRAVPLRRTDLLQAVHEQICFPPSLLPTPEALGPLSHCVAVTARYTLSSAPCPL